MLHLRQQFLRSLGSLYPAVRAGSVVDGGGADHSVAIRADGTRWGWGYNQDFELGDGTTTNHSSPVQLDPSTNWNTVSAGNLHTIGLRTGP